MFQDNQNIEFKGHMKLKLRNQGGFIIALLMIFYGYFGLICNLLMFDDLGNQINYPELQDNTILIWTYLKYLQMRFIPALLLFFICFYLTYKQDIPQYGIKHSLWFVPIIIFISIIWHWVIFGISIEPFILLFMHVEGYMYIIILLAINLSGALLGMALKHYVIKKREVQLNV